ncbi:MAG: quinoprotein glucose dehydrogenase, partial [Acidobacteriaceae bacterium]|nr:quinoprotein glucose dehydrogenase [Acidobacteriaceae bacterium]
ALPGQACKSNPLPRSSDWPVYGGQVEGDHYSSLSQINWSNVQRLKQAWTFDAAEEGGLETNPIIIGRTLFAYTASQKVIALDASTGKLRWKFDSGLHSSQPVRGLAFWSDGQHGRILAGVMNYLYALDADTGKVIPSFGEQGRIDLRKGLRGDYLSQSVTLTSPGIVYQDLIIVGGRNPETYPSPPGDIRALDVLSGTLRWSFHTIPHPGEFGYSTWPADAWKTAGSANNWAGMALDEQRGIVYVPTGSAVFDFYGADRVGDDLFADTLLALDARTGKRLWHFQGVHHDIWDRDFPSPPALVTVRHNGSCVDAVAQTTKQGFLYLFERTNGKPLFPIEERPYPASDVPGEVTSPTQPSPIFPAPFTRQMLTADLLTTRTPEAHEQAVKEFATFRSGGQFLPIGLNQETVVFPCFLGGAEWGGPAVDRTRGVIYVNANEMACVLGLTENQPTASTGARIYHNQCSLCHGKDLAGSPPQYPSLVDVGKRLSPEQIEARISLGGGRMPSFPNLRDAHLQALIRFLTKQGETDAKDPDEGGIYSAAADGTTMKYEVTGSRDFLDVEGYPAITPPWGTLNAIDLNTGRYLWKIPLGEYPELAAKGMRNTGSENYGGPIVTAGNLLFIGATAHDKKFRAFDSRNGKLLWETVLPFAGTATPATYMIDGTQYVVIASGGTQFTKGPTGSVYVAFSLP